jgi:hypothetical protein
MVSTSRGENSFSDGIILPGIRASSPGYCKTKNLN